MKKKKNFSKRNQILPIKILKKRLFKKWGNLVHLDNFSYKGMGVKARFIHSKFGEIWAIPNNYLRQRHSHYKAAILSRKNTAKDIERKLREQGRTDIVLNKITYIDTKNKAEFIDKDYGSWFASPSNVLSQRSKHPQRSLDEHPKSTISLEKTKKLLKQAHGNKVKIKESTYINFTTKCIFIDPIFGEWEAIPDLVIRQKTRHPKHIESKKECEVRNIFQKLTKSKFIKIRPKWLINPISGLLLELDGYCEDLKIAFEYDGEFHYLPIYGEGLLKYQKKKDVIKNKLCKKNAVHLIRISFRVKDKEKYIKKELTKIGCKIWE